MRKTFTLWAVLGALFFSTANAQTQIKRCGTVEIEQQLQQTDPVYKARRAQNERAIQQYLNNQQNARTNVTRTIPVVFHVVYGNAAQNISQAQIMSQLDILNADFRKMNADTTSIPGPFKQLASDTEIEFCLASVDPNGQPTTGITRTATTVPSFDTSAPNLVKTTAQGGKDPWPNTQYLNIWICNLTSPLLGYATPPGASAASDGVVLLYTSVGKAPHNPFPGVVNSGRTATHEVGHWLDLKHIWGDDNGTCNADDLVTDTPQQYGENYGCPTYPLLTGTGASCATTGPGAMFMNYMDYTNDNCMHMFTHGQKARMIAALTTSRASLLTSMACSNTLRANFSANNTSITAGNAVNFFDNSTGAPTGWSWSFPGGTPATSTAQNPASIQYNAAGTYNVTLTVTKGTATDTRTINNFVTVANSVACVDTLNLPFAGTPVIYVSQNAAGVRNGYVSGNNAYGHKAKAEKFVSASTTINGGIFAFGRAKFATTASTVTVAVWNAAGTNGAPGTIVASTTVPINTIAANIAANQLTTVTFPTPVAVTGNFYMGVVLPNTPGDTIALITNTHSTAAPAGKGWEQLSTNAWIPYSDPNGWSLNLSNAVFPIVAGGAPVVSFTSNLNTICSGNTVTFNSNATTGANTYNWSFPGGTPATSTQPNPTVTYNTPGNYNVSLTASNSNCSLTTTVTQTNAISVVTPPPGPPVANFTIPSTTVCVGSPVTFNGTSTTGATAYAWFFQGGSQTSSTLQSPTITYNTPGTYNVSLTAHAGTGPCALNNVKTMVINVVALPNVNITPASAVICANPTQLTASGASTYSWSPATGLSATTGATVTASPSVTTVYTVTGTTAAGCVSTDTVQVIVPNITADFTPSGKYFDHRNGAATVTFTNNSTNATSFEWNFGEPGLSTNNVSLLHTPAPVTYPYTGTFYVTLKATANGCTEIHRDTIVVRNTTGLNEAFDNGLIKIYPNPAKNYLQVEIPATEKVSGIQLINAVGQVIARQKPEAGTTRLNVTHLPAGIYFVKITNAEGSIMKKISIAQ